MEIKIKKIHTKNYLLRKLPLNKAVRVLFMTRGEYGRVMQGHIGKYNICGRERLVLFNNNINSHSLHELFKNEEAYNYASSILTENNYMGLYLLDSSNPFFGGVTNLCVEFSDENEAQFQNCLANNPKILNPIFSKYGIDKNSACCKLLFLYSSGSANFMAWAIKNICNRSTSIYSILAILTWNRMYSNIANKLSKGTITAYNNISDINQLMIEMSNLRKNKRINDSINQFNTQQKKLLKNVELNDDEKNALAKMKRLSPVVQTNFVRKMSTIDNTDEIFSQLHHLVNTHFKWNKESFIDYVTNGENLKCKIVFNNNNIVIVEVFDYDTIKKIAKNSNWCISKNRQYWENYINDHNRMYVKQFVMCDFSKKEDDVLSMVGFTITKGRITAAHNFVNDNMLRDSPDVMRNKKSFIFLSDSIFSILNENNISIDLLSSHKEKNNNKKSVKLMVEWNKEKIIDFLFNMKNKGKTFILKNNDNKLIVLCTDFNIFTLVKYSNRDYNTPISYTNVLCFDFSKSFEETGSLYYFPIRYENDFLKILNGYDNNINVIDKNVISLLLEENISLEYICGIDNDKKLYETLIYNNMIQELDYVFKTNKNYNALSKLSEFLSRELYVSICEYGSFDLLKCLYDNNIQLNRIMKDADIYNMLENIIHRITSNKLYLTINMSEEQYNSMWNYVFQRNLDRRVITIMGYMTAIHKFIENEKNNKDYYSRMLEYISKSSPFTMEIVLESAKKINLNKVTDEFINLVKFASRNNVNEVFEIFNNRGLINKKVLEKTVEIMKLYGGSRDIVARFQDLFESKYNSKIEDIHVGEEKKFSEINTDDLLQVMSEMFNRRR